MKYFVILLSCLIFSTSFSTLHASEIELDKHDAKTPIIQTTDWQKKNISKKAARKELKEKYYVNHRDCSEFKKAFKNNNADEVELFLIAGMRIKNGFFEPALVKGFKYNNWDIYKVLVAYPDKIGFKAFGLIKCDLETTSMHYGLSDIFNEYSKELKSICPYFDKIASIQSDDMFKIYSYNGDYKEVYPYKILCLGVAKTYVDLHRKDVDVALNQLSSAIKLCINGNVRCPLDKSSIIYSESNYSYIREIFAYLVEENESLCNSGKKLKYCKAVKDFNESASKLYAQKRSEYLDKQMQIAQAEVEKRKREEQAKAYAKTPKYYKEQACHALDLMQSAESSIAYQNRISNTSGYVNKVALYRAGELKVYATDRLDEFLKKYQKKTGRKLDLTKCE